MEVKQKIQFEYPMKASPEMLFQYISTPSGLSEWFAEKVDSNGNSFNFYWGDIIEKAVLLTRKIDRYVRFRWKDEKDEQAYFEFRIEEDELTGDVSLFIIDFIEFGSLKEAKTLWDNHIQDLRAIIGA